MAVVRLCIISLLQPHEALFLFVQVMWSCAVLGVFRAEFNSSGCRLYPTHFYFF